MPSPVKTLSLFLETNSKILSLFKKLIAVKRSKDFTLSSKFSKKISGVKFIL
jgi:hypothetical protein